MSSSDLAQIECSAGEMMTSAGSAPARPSWLSRFSDPTGAGCRAAIMAQDVWQQRDSRRCTTRAVGTGSQVVHAARCRRDRVQQALRPRQGATGSDGDRERRLSSSAPLPVKSRSPRGMSLFRTPTTGYQAEAVGRLSVAADRFRGREQLGGRRPPRHSSPVRSSAGSPPRTSHLRRAHPTIDHSVVHMSQVIG